jgi:hypothetical protein
MFSAHFLQSERAHQPQGGAVLDEALDVLPADQRQIVAELLAVEVVEASAVGDFLVRHLVKDCGGGREVCAQALGESAVNSAVLFLVGDGERENFLFGQVGKSFHGESLRYRRGANIYLRTIPIRNGCRSCGPARRPVTAN